MNQDMTIQTGFVAPLSGERDRGSFTPANATGRGLRLDERRGWVSGLERASYPVRAAHVTAPFSASRAWRPPIS